MSSKSLQVFRNPQGVYMGFVIKPAPHEVMGIMIEEFS
jgi:hypothetical protein